MERVCAEVDEGGPRNGRRRAKKKGEKRRERGAPCPASNKLVIIFSQYLSWIGCYFIIFYCLLLLLLPVRSPGFPRQPSSTNTTATTVTTTVARLRPGRSVLLSRASPHRGNSLAELIIEGFILL